MGLFDRLVGNRQEPLSPQSGLLLSAITMVAVDGDVDDDELAIIRRLDGSRTTDDWELAVKAWKMNSVQDCIGLTAKAMNQEQRIVAIANLIDIAMADGILHGKEKELLEAYVEAFAVDESIVEKIVDIISVKNNKALFSK